MDTSSPGAPAAMPRRKPGIPKSRRGLWIALGIIGVSVFILAPLSGPNLRRTLTLFGSDPSLTIAVTMSGRIIVPAEIRVPHSAAVKFEVLNLDGPRDGHRFKTTGQNFDLDLATWGGQTKSEVMLTALQPGRYPFLCSIRGHATEGMVGVLIVE
jgi:plastocyanin